MRVIFGEYIDILLLNLKLCAYLINISNGAESVVLSSTLRTIVNSVAFVSV